MSHRFADYRKAGEPAQANPARDRAQRQVFTASLFYAGAGALMVSGFVLWWWRDQNLPSNLNASALSDGAQIWVSPQGLRAHTFLTELSDY